jgi:AraC-like DNA-binding protein
MDRLAGLVCLGYGSLAHRTAYAERTASGSYGVIYVHAGSGWVDPGATVGRQAVEAGTLIWLFPGVAYSVAPSAMGWSEEWALFDGPLAQSFELLGLLSRARPVVRPPDSRQISALFSQLRADFTGGAPLAALLAGATLHRLILVAQDPGGIAAPADRSLSHAMERAVALIEATAFRPLDLETIARACGIGSSTLRRHFKRITGQSITDHVRRIRLQRARELLTRTSMSVAEVAHAVGFTDPFYFSRLFRRIEGQSPTAFRHAGAESGRMV